MCPEIFFTRKKGHHSPNFKATWETTQGGLISLTLFNVVVDNMVRTCLAMTVEYQTVAQEGLRINVGICLGVLYDDNGMIRTVLRVDPERAQRPHWPLPEVLACRKHHKVSEDDGTTWSTTVGHVR